MEAFASIPPWLDAPDSSNMEKSSSNRSRSVIWRYFIDPTISFADHATELVKYNYLIPRKYSQLF